jgi:hypothetical protein
MPSPLRYLSLELYFVAVAVAVDIDAREAPLRPFQTIANAPTARAAMASIRV